MVIHIDERKNRVPSACGVTGIMNTKGVRMRGDDIVKSICNMMFRGNGLGSGYAAYGIYPDHKNDYCFHVMYGKESSLEAAEAYIFKHFDVALKEPIPTKFVKTLHNMPILRRYFLQPKEELLMPLLEKTGKREVAEEDYVLEKVMFINREIGDAFVFSSGKDMGAFKGVGNPDEIAEFYRIPEYKGYLWTAHNRFPTNSVAWWGGAHPFGILSWTVVHNGEISSYGINRRYLENFGYYCTLSTDTEVISYLFDLLVRKHGLSYDDAANVLAAPFWSQVEREDPEKKEYYTRLRMIYGPALLNGPFAIIVATNKTMIGLNDRTKLRPLVAGRKGDNVYIASEEAAIRCVNWELDEIWMPNSGEPVIVELKDDK